ncbi:hypothetical protein HW49_08920 [Porphyromonadaceae bacterium COT-184 OH4590]|nr:hypothetical protein HW49_08920 [Porphyromonadaceae bacterium COT-184 OH4590]
MVEMQYIVSLFFFDVSTLAMKHFLFSTNFQRKKSITDGVQLIFFVILKHNNSFFEKQVNLFYIKETLLDLKETLLDLKEAILDFKEAILDLKETLLDLKEAILDLKETLLDFKETFLDFKETFLDFKETLLDLKETILDFEEMLLHKQKNVLQLVLFIFIVQFLKFYKLWATQNQQKAMRKPFPKHK